MKKDKIRLYLLEITLLIILFFTLFVLNIFNRSVLALVLIFFTFIVRTLIKGKKIMSIYKNQITWIMTGFSIIYILVFYILGIYFGFYKSSILFGINTIFKFIIPLIFIILCSEIIRKTLIVQKDKISRFLVFIIMVLIDLIVYSGVYNINKLDDVLTVLGFILFSSIACNLLYNYITIRYGIKGIIIYRLVTILYVYIIPYIPNVYIFFRAFLRMLYPFIIYLVLEYTYSKTNYAIEYKDKHKKIIEIIISFLFTCLIVVLVSCQFKYGILVIGTGSMSGTLDVGDVILFETYQQESIEEGNIIIYNNNGLKTIHRVIKIENVNNEYHYYTKGDANQREDENYRLKKDIVGVVKFKIKYIGFPSLWIRDIFS